VWGTDRTARRGRWRDVMTTMDFWYDRMIYEMADLNEEATELRRNASESLPSTSAEETYEEDE